MTDPICGYMLVTSIHFHLSPRCFQKSLYFRIVKKRNHLVSCRLTTFPFSFADQTKHIIFVILPVIIGVGAAVLTLWALYRRVRKASKETRKPMTNVMDDAECETKLYPV